MMKNKSNLRWLTARFLTAALLLVACATRVSANVSEPPDFPNITAGPATTLTNGANVFSGTLTTPSDIQDRFNVTVPPGLRITQVTKNFPAGGVLQSPNVSFNGEDQSGTGTATFTNGYPLGSGTYSAIVSAGTASANAWSVTFTVGPAPNYSVSTTFGAITVTDDSGNSDTLNITNPAAGSIKFAAAGRTFAINGGALISNDTGNLSLSGVSDISVSCGNSNDIVNVSAFSGSTFPNLTIYGGGGNNTVNFNGDITFAANSYLDVELQNYSPDTNSVNLAANVNLITSGTGSIYMFASQNIQLNSGSSLVAQNGDIDVEANQQTPATTGNFIGVNLDDAIIQSTGSGYVTVNGCGGNDAGGYQLGVQVINGAKIIGGNTTNGVFVLGTGGNSTNIVNRGVTVYGTGSAITSSGADVNVTGFAGTNSAHYGIGVSVLFGGQIGAGGTGSIQVTGTGAGQTGSGYSQGLELAEVGSLIYSSGGNITITGTAGPGSDSYGVYLADNGAITTPAAGGTVNFHSDSVSIDATASINTTNLASAVLFAPLVLDTTIDLGGVDAPGDPATLGLTDAELDRVQTANLVFSNASSGTIYITAPISHPTATNITFLPGSGGFFPGNAGTDISLNGTVRIPSGALDILLFGTDVDTGYLQFNVAGQIHLTGTTLAVGAAAVGGPGSTFTIVNNDGTDPIVGTFNGLPEGSFINLAGLSNKARISYVGGDGNDVVLTLVGQQPALTGAGGLVNGNWSFTGLGFPTNIYTIQATTNFINWTNVGQSTSSVNGAFSFIDTNAFRFQYRFYRTTN